MKRAVPSLLLLALALAAAHVVFSYLPRERAETPPPLPLAQAVQPAEAAQAPAAVEPLRLLAVGAYDVCVWVPYPHQNLGALAGAIGDLQDVVGAAARLSSGEGAPAAKEPEEPPTFGPFEVPPASELAACADLAGGRLRVVARIYPLLAAVAKVAGRIADNPWLAGGEAGRARIAWDGRLWSVTEGEDEPPAPPEPPATSVPGAAESASLPASPPGSALPAQRQASAAGAPPSSPAPPAPAPAPVPAAPLPARFVQLPESLAVVRWTGVRPEIPAGYYALTRSGSDLALSLAGAAVGAGSVPASPAPRAALLIAAGPEWPGGNPLGGSSSGREPAQPPASSASPSPVTSSLTPPAASTPMAPGSSGPLPPAALALFETGGSHLSSLGDLPGLAVFNRPGPSGAERWSLPTSGLFRLLARRLPTADLAGWRIVALDPGSLRQAEAVAPRLAAMLPPPPAAPGVMPAAAAALPGSAPATIAGPALAGAGTGASLGARLSAAAPDTGAGAAPGARPPAAAPDSVTTTVPGAASTGVPGSTAVPGVPAASSAAAPGSAGAGPAAGRLSLGVWLDPRSALRMVSRIRRFVEGFPLSSRRQVQLWRDWETILDPLANCDRATLAATASPPSMRLLLQGCTSTLPSR